MDPFSPPTNYIGTLLFLSYILAALVLTLHLLSPLYALYTTPPPLPSASRSQIHTTALLTLLLFTTLSTTMLSVLVRSYTQHTTPSSSFPSLPLPIPPTPASLQTWMLETELFADFARDLLRDAQSWTWAQAALVWTFGASVWIAVEGNARRGEIKAKLWKAWLGMLVVLAQVLPVGFAVGVLELAGRILDGAREGEHEQERMARWAERSAKMADEAVDGNGKRGGGEGKQIAGAWKHPVLAIAVTEVVYISLLILPPRYLLLSHASSNRSDTALILYIFATRACLALPYLIATYSRTTPTHQSAKPIYLSLLVAGGILSVWWAMKCFQADVGGREMAGAWRASPPVSAIAVDAMVGAGAVGVLWASRGWRK